MTAKGPDPALYAGDLFGEFYQTHSTPAPRRLALRELVPGLLTCLTAALAALWLSEHYGFPAILLGLLIGLALNFLAQLESLGAGLDFTARHFLRIGIVLLGLQVTLTDLSDLGWMPFVGLALVMASAFAAGIAGARMSDQDRYTEALAGGATAICGASAALALYAVIGEDRLDRARFTVTLVGVALASALALSLYPAIAAALGLSDVQTGYLVGASIHDAAQAIGGGYAISDAAGEQATIIKLTRVALLAPVIALVALWLGRGSAEEEQTRPIWRRIPVPWFILVFLMLVAVSSAITVPPALAERGLDASKFLLLLAVTATAMRSRLSLLLEAGWRPLVPVFAATTVSFAAALGAAILLIE